MRLCFIANEFVTEPTFSGGLANYLGRITVALAERGHRVHVMTRAEEAGTVDYHGVTVHRVVPLWDRGAYLNQADRFVPRVLYSRYQDVKAAWSLWHHWRRVQSRERFDLVQVANVLAVGLFFRRRERAPVVVRMSSYRPHWDTAAGVRPDLKVRSLWKLEEWSVRGRPFVYAPSAFVARLVEENYRTPVRVIETPFFREQAGHDPSAYDRHARGKEYGLFFGRLTQMKGVHVLAQALPRVLAACPDMHFFVAGSDYLAPDGGSMREYVRRLSGPHADRVHLLDALRHEQLYPLIDRARFIALPSLLDNLPNTLLESMGHGKLVIGTTGSCFEQLIEDGRSGLLVPPADPDRLAEAMLRAWAMPEAEREALGARARARVDELHPDRAVPRLIEYYEQVIDSHRRDRA
jgi:glycosyltransferase involved in cell wall biosynthesis